jgi:hypothetical protein
MNAEERRRAADAILHVPFFHDLFDEIEKQAVDACVYAKHDDHEARQAYAAEVRVIRKLRQRLETISKEGESSAGRSAPA